MTASRAVRNSTGTSTPDARSAWQTSRPSESGSPMSSTTAERPAGGKRSSAARQVAAATTRSPSASRLRISTERRVGSSSQTPTASGVMWTS